MELLSIRKLQDGGYIVGEPSWRPSETPPAPTLACTSLDEALKYIKSKLEPKATK